MNILRDIIALSAGLTLINRHQWVLDEDVKQETVVNGLRPDYQRVAAWAYSFADAMLIRRKQ